MKTATRKLAEADAKAEAEQKLAQQPVDEQAKLLDELKQAQADGDWKLVASKAKLLADYQAKLEALEHEAKTNKLTAIANDMLAELDAIVKAYMANGKLDIADGVWFEHSFAETSCAIRLTAKPTASTRKASTTGYGKKFAETTEALLQAHGNEEYKDGLTYKEAWDAKTDKNSRYAVRKKLTEKYGTPTS